MPAPTRHEILDSVKTWVTTDNSADPIRTKMVIVRTGDRNFIKLFPDFTKGILEALRTKKLQGAGDVLFYFLDRLMTVQVNGTEQEIGIRASAEEIVAATGKSVRAVRNNLATLIGLGFMEQPHRGIPIYRIPPDLAYRGCLRKLREREAQRGAKPMDQVMQEMKAARPPREKK